MPTNTSFAVIIPAAGIGSRMAASTAKQYLRIANKTILEHTIEVFLDHKLIDQVIVALHPQDTLFANLPLASHPKVQKIIGGVERVDSVLAGLHYLSNTRASDEYVLVHDAARPCISTDDITRLIEQCCSTNTLVNTGGAILACPITDTVKQAQVNNTGSTANVSPVIIDKTIDRSLLWQAQTPQMFVLQTLTTAIEKGLENGVIITDEASAIEADGGNVQLVEGPSSNIKVTKPADLSLAAFYLSRVNTNCANLDDKK